MWGVRVGEKRKRDGRWGGEEKERCLLGKERELDQGLME